MVAVFVAAGLLAQQGAADYRAQAENWRREAAAKPSDARVWSNLGVTLHMAGEDAQAIQALKKAVRLDASLAAAQLFLGLSLTRSGKPREATAHLTRASQLDSRGVLPPLGLARAYAAIRDFAAANQAYYEAARREPGNSEAWYGLGITYRSLLAEASQRLAAASSSADSGLAAAATYTRRDFEQALRNPAAQLSLARICRPLALDALSRATAADPNSVQARLILAESLRDSGRENEAIREYEAAVRLDPAAPAANFGLALAQWQAGQADIAEKSARKVLELTPNDPDAAALLADLLSRRGERQEASSLARLAFERGPNSDRARVTFARIALAEGRAGEAVAALEPALPNDRTGALFYFYSQALRRAGRTREAAAALARFQTLRDLARSTGAGRDSLVE